MAAQKTKTAEQRLARIAQIRELYLQCLSMAEIGRQLGLSAATVYRDICSAREQWRTRAADAIEQHKQRELGKIDIIEVEAWRAWKRSIGIAKTVTTKNTTIEAPDGSNDIELPAEERTVREEDLAGDPRFLEIARKCVEDRRKVLGLDAPVKSAFTDTDGKPVTEIICKVVGLPNATQ
jgi:hypothetical protein